MTKNPKISRRSVLKAFGVGAATAGLAACAAPPAAQAPAATQAPAAEAPKPTDAPTSAPAAAGAVTLDVVMDTPEYQNQHRQIFDIYEQENPGVKVNFQTFSEDGQAAFVAKVAGGYLPAMETAASSGNNFKINKDSFQNAIDISTIDFPYFDQFLYDLKGAWTGIYGESGPRGIDPFLGVVLTWVFHKDMLDKAGLNPIGKVKSWNDLKQWLEEGTKWSKSADSGVQFFWDQAWLNPWFAWHLLYDSMNMAFADGQRPQQVACWKGEKKFNAEDSPYRHFLEFYKEAYEKGWLPENFWTRRWEEDMESSFAAKKSAVMLHGPWPWDKTLAIDPKSQLEGLPATPPADGQSQWMQLQSDSGIDGGSMFMFMRAGNEKKPEWENIRKLFIWWHSPEIIRLRGEAIGFIPAVKLDPPPNLKGPQLATTVLEIEKSGGKWENVKWERSVSGELQMGAKRKGGSPGLWDDASGNIAKNWADLMTGKINVQQMLDIAQKNYEASYT